MQAGHQGTHDVEVMKDHCCSLSPSFFPPPQYRTEEDSDSSVYATIPRRIPPVATMDPDIPAPSIEHDALPRHNIASPKIHINHHHHHLLHSAASVPLPPSSPMRTPYKPSSAQNKSLSPRPPSRSPSVASFRSDRQTPPTLAK